MRRRGVVSRFATGVVAATLFVGSAASAAPQTVDPLVALSLFGTAESRAAVCGDAASGCVLPMSTAAVAQPADDVPPAMVESRGVSILPLLLGLGAVAAAALLLLNGDSDANIELPVSPV
jgi:hypothetical protein